MRFLTHLRNREAANIAIYALATGLAALLILVQTRLLWRALTAANFGVWALLDPMLVPVAALVLLGIDHGIVKQSRVDQLPLRVVVGNLLITTLPATTLCLAVVGVACHFMFQTGWTAALVLTVVGEALMLMMQTAFRSNGAVGLFAALLLSRNLLYVAVLLGVQWIAAPWAAGPPGDGAETLSIGLVFLSRGGCVIAVSLAAMAALRPAPRVDWTRYRDAVHYGFPLLATTIIYGVTDMTDRWFLAEFTGVVAVGIYALHLKLAAILSQAVVIPFGLWFPPERFRRMNDPDEGRAFFIRTAAALALICGYLSGCLWLTRDRVLPLIAPNVAASPLVLACCLGSVTCLALSHALNVGLLIPGHTRKNTVCSAYAIATAVVAAAVLVPLFGMNGAAASRLLGGLVLVVVTAAMSHRVFPIAFPFVSIGVYYIAAGAAAVGIDGATSHSGLAGLVAALVAWTAVTGVAAALLWRRVAHKAATS